MLGRLCCPAPMRVFRFDWFPAVAAMAMGVASVALLSFPAQAADYPTGPRHGLSVFGDLKYPPDFKHFDYVNPDAPKGGQIRTNGVLAVQTFDNFNPHIIKGDPAQHTELLFDSLMERAADEPDAMYGLVAETAEVAPDRKSVTFKLRPQARFSDGSPVTAEDVAFTLETLRTKGDPSYELSMRDIIAGEVIDPLTIRFSFKGDNVRDLPVTVASLPVFSKAYWQGKDFTEPKLEVPLGSGPYKVKAFVQRSSVTYERRADYWAKDLPVNRGRYNLDLIKIDYFSDRDVGLQALLAGDLDLREEFSSRSWATQYESPAIKAGKLIKNPLPDGTPGGSQGFFFNLRRAKFSDPRLREALGLAFDFEWANKNLFYGAYKRTSSFFQNTPMMAEGLPSPGELTLLEPHRKALPAAVFDKPVPVPFVTDGTGQDRAPLRMAKALLAEAGWKNVDGKLLNAAGEQLSIEFLLDDDGYNRILAPYIQKLEQLGAAAVIKIVDVPQYESRQKSYDFDVLTARYTGSATPGIELRASYSSESANREATPNLAGISDKVVDALIEQVALAPTRDTQVTAAKALDRVLRTSHYWVPQWNGATYRVAHWNRYSWPAIKPTYDRGILDTWWYDPAKDATTK
jgi:microcin C transport system substrate-binding protein